MTKNKFYLCFVFFVLRGLRSDYLSTDFTE